MTDQAKTPDNSKAVDDNTQAGQSTKPADDSAPATDLNTGEQASETAEQAEPAAEPVKTDPSEPPEQPAQTTAPQPVKKSSGVLAWLAFLIALAGLGLAGWLYWLEMQKGQQTELLKNQLSNKQTELALSIQAKQADQAETLKRQLEQNLNAHQNQLERELTEQKQSVQKTIDAFSSSINKSQTQAVLVDVRHLIQLASRKLYIEQDKAGAVAVLKLAQAELSGAQNSQWFNLSNQISTDIATIQALPEIDVQTLYLKITELNQQLQLLPLNQAYIPKNEQVTQQRETSSTISWQNIELIWQQFLELFLPKKREGSVEPLLTPSQEQNLRQNLTSKLNQAQWAVLNTQPAIYQSALSQTQQWVKTYLQLENPQTSELLTGLEQLKQAKLSDNLSAVELGSPELVSAIIRRAAQNNEQVDL